MKDQRKRVAKRLASGLLAGALALGGLALSGGEVSANTPSSPTTSRISGADRYETAVAVARAQLNTTNTGAVDTVTNTPDSLIVASGENWADALAGASLVTANRPLLLVKKDSIPAAVSDFIADYKSSFATGSKRVYVLGGTNAISAATVTALTSAITTAGSLTPPVVTRLSGDDRYATAKAISDVTGVTLATDSMIIVNGENFPDALSAGGVAAVTGWPMLLSSSTGLQASLKAKIDSYLALPGSIKSFVIIGGTAAVPSAVTEYLINTKSVPSSNIRRIAGADRYQTNFLVNSEYLLTVFGGDSVALVSGEAPWDALAASGFALKTDTHIVLTPAAGGNINVSTLAATLAAYNDAGYQTNRRLWVIGGRSAVADAAKTGYVAASATDLTSTLTCTGTPGSTVATVTLALSGTVDPDDADLEHAMLTSASAMGNLLKKNNVSLAGSVSASSDAFLLVPTGDTEKTYSIRLAAPLLATDVITFSGVVEGSTTITPAFVPTRSIGSSSCTVAADVTRPTVTLTAVSGPGGTTSASGGFLWLNSTEAITVGAQTSLGTQGAIGSAPITVDGVAVTTMATVLPLDASTVDGYATQFLISLTNPTTGAGAYVIPHNKVVSIAKGQIADRAGLAPSLDVSGTSGTDSVVPTFTPAAVRQTTLLNAQYISNSLSVSASPSGAYAGALGSGYSMRIVNQRGLISPTFAVDATAKTITVTADVGYHTPADVAMARRNLGVSGWVIGANAGFLGTSPLTATISPATCVTGRCGTDVVELLLIASEPTVLQKSGLSVAVGGFSGAPFVTVNSVNFVATGNTSGGYKLGAPGQGFLASPLASTTWIVNLTTQYVGAGTIAFSAASQAAAGGSDLWGNYAGIAPVSFTTS